MTTSDKRSPKPTAHAQLSIGSTGNANTSQERWGALTPPLEGYEVSDQGRVRSYRVRGHAGYLATHAKLVEPWIDPNGYVHVTLSTYKRPKRYSVHSLVLRAFVGEPEPKWQTRHLNGVRHDNRLTNLCWGTALENDKDKDPHGTRQFGAAIGTAKLTDGDVILIRELYAAGGVTQQMLAERFGVHQTNISLIICGKFWKRT